MEMAPATISANPRTVEEIFKDFSARRTGLVRALTSGDNRSPPPRLPRSTCSPCIDLTLRSLLASSPVQKWRISTPTATQVSETDLPPSCCVWVRGGTERIREFVCLRADKENLCLYGLPNGNWEVGPPAEEVPPEMPEPALGINFARDGMQRRDWLSLVAVHSDSWLLAVAFFFGTRLNANDRYRFYSPHGLF